jgi:hypothetical protein
MLMSQVKGSALGGFKRYVETQHGSKDLEVWLRDASPADAELLGGIILPSAWYPIGTWNRLVNSYVARLGAGKPDSFRPVAAFIAENDLNLIFKVLLKVASPEAILNRSPSLWDRYFDGGKLAAESVGRRLYQLTMTGPTGNEQAAGPVTCGPGVAGWLEKGLSLAGAQFVMATHTACRFKGGKTCLTEISWR